MKNKFKIFVNILLYLIIIMVLSLLIFFIIHKIKTKNEYQYLKNHGYINLVNVGNYKLNIYKYGNNASKHKLIGISGRGVNNYNIEMKYALKDLEKDNQIIFIDRAGYGYSDDTKIKQSVQQVVSDYRNALKNAQIEPPYILMPHSLGGIYATYWESMYPDEIEGVIFIDTSELGIDVWEKEDYSVNIIDRIELLLSKIGLQRLVLYKYYYTLPENYSKEDQKISDYLNINSSITTAMLSEIKETNNNTNITFNSIIKNDIPKIYINASTGFNTIEELKEYDKWIKARQEELKIAYNKKEINDEIMVKILTQYKNWREEKIIPYIDKLGNTELVYLPGDHMIFEQKPDELNEIIKEFVKKLNK